MRRAQITIFLIIAALAILAAGIGWYLVTTYGDTDDATLTRSVDQNQVERFVEACLEASSKDVFLRIGEQAGYMDPIRDGIPPATLLPTEGPAFEPFTGITTPYWSYLSSPNDCTQCLHASQQPPLEGTAFPAIQYQAEAEIVTKTLECLNGFAELEEQFTIEPQRSPAVTVTFGAKDIAVAMDYPLDVIDGSGQRTQVGRYQTVLDIPFRRLYEVADEITKLSDATGYFELRTLEEITLTSLDEGNPLPPPNGGMDIGYDPGPFWTVIGIDPLVRTSLERGILMTQLFGSRDADWVSTGDFMNDSLYLKYYLSLNQDYPDVAANFVYLADWPLYLDVNPGSGQLIKPEIMSVGVPFIPNIKRLDFQYDVSYPLLIQLRSATKDGDYLFQFPIEVNLRRNSPTTFTPIVLNPSLQDLCDPTTMNGPELRIRTLDQDRNPLAARTTFECVNAACPLGETRGGTLTTRVPACLQGVLIAEREGYRTTEVALDALSPTQDVEVTLDKLTTVQVELVGLKLTKGSSYSLEYDPLFDPLQPLSVSTNNIWRLESEETLLTAQQSAIVDITPVGKEDDAQFIVIPARDQGRTTMDLAPGEYTITVFVLENLTEPLVLASQEVEGQTIPSVTLGTPQVVNPENGEVIDTGSTAIPVGGLTWDGTTKTIRISENDLLAGKLRIPVVVIDTASLQKVLDLQVFEQVDALSKDLTLLPVSLDEIPSEGVAPGDAPAGN